MMPRGASSSEIADVVPIVNNFCGKPWIPRVCQPLWQLGSILEDKPPTKTSALRRRLMLPTQMALSIDPLS